VLLNNLLLVAKLETRVNVAMKIIVIGAGASLEQSIRLGVDKALRSPLIGNFGATLWTSNLALPQSLHEYMARYLRECGQEPGLNAVTTFVRLEVLANAKINVERFFEFAWAHRNESYSGAWGDLIYGAVVNVLVDLFARNGFFENGVGWKPLNAYQALAKKLDPGDLVVNLNYEPLFEMGAMQAGCKLAYVPNVAQPGEFLVAKPHGSINLIVEKDKFWFSEPDIIGSQMAPGEHMDQFRGIVPPRYGKSFDQHPVAVRIFEAIRDYRPESVTFWGVGFTSSDADLTKAYEGWCSSASKISLVHPSPTTEVADAERMLKRGIQHFSQPEDWDY
jgi:hypothetical protein